MSGKEREEINWEEYTHYISKETEDELVNLIVQFLEKTKTENFKHLDLYEFRKFVESLKNDDLSN